MNKYDKVLEWLYTNDNKFPSKQAWRKEFCKMLKEVLDPEVEESKVFDMKDPINSTQTITPIIIKATKKFKKSYEKYKKYLRPRQCKECSDCGSCVGIPGKIISIDYIDLDPLKSKKEKLIEKLKAGPKNTIPEWETADVIKIIESEMASW